MQAVIHSLFYCTGTDAAAHPPCCRCTVVIAPFIKISIYFICPLTQKEVDPESLPSFCIEKFVYFLITIEYVNRSSGIINSLFWSSCHFLHFLPFYPVYSSTVTSSPSTAE
nr:MAG TPA: hypothetical protein [Caudoviricetes sp.]